jgi:putative (di)nucleoside polyphosphate hydrolase
MSAARENSPTPPAPGEREPLLADLPYRPNVGICLFNASGFIFAGRTILNPHGWPDPEIFDVGSDWCLPQGGIDAGEDIETAARRELWEETGVRSAELLAITPDWWCYDFPLRGRRDHKLYPFRGQTQRWVGFRFTGNDSEVSISADHTGEPAEFLEWRWRRLADLPAIGPRHRRAIYHKVVDTFAHLEAP